MFFMVTCLHFRPKILRLVIVYFQNVVLIQGISFQTVISNLALLRI